MALSPLLTNSSTDLVLWLQNVKLLSCVFVHLVISLMKFYFLQVCKSASMDPSKSDNNRWWTYDHRNSGIRNGGREGPGLNVCDVLLRPPSKPWEGKHCRKIFHNETCRNTVPFLFCFFGDGSRDFSGDKWVSLLSSFWRFSLATAPSSLTAADVCSWAGSEAAGWSWLRALWDSMELVILSPSPS